MCIWGYNFPLLLTCLSQQNSCTPIYHAFSNPIGTGLKNELAPLSNYAILMCLECRDLLKIQSLFDYFFFSNWFLWLVIQAVSDRVPVSAFLKLLYVAKSTYSISTNLHSSTMHSKNFCRWGKGFEMRQGRTSAGLGVKSGLQPGEGKI